MRFNTLVNPGVWLWARTEWRRRWGALAILAVVVAIGGGSTIAAAAAARRTDTAFSRMLQTTHEANLTVNGIEGLVDLDPALLDQVAQIDGVHGLRELAIVSVAPDQYPNYFAFAAIASRGDAPGFISVEGAGVAHVENLAVDEVMVNEAMRDRLGQGVGATLNLKSLSAEQFASQDQNAEIASGGPSMTAQIVGVGRGADSVTDAPDPLLVLSRAFYDRYHRQIGNCRCIVSINAEPAAVDAIAADLAGIYPSATVERGEDLAVRIADTVALQRRAWWVIALTAALAGAVALLMAGTRFARMLTPGDDARRALGMTRRQRQFGRFLVVAPAALVGTLAAAGVAYAMSAVAPVGITRRAEPALGLRWDPTVVIPGAAAVLVLALLMVALGSVVTGRSVERIGNVAVFGGPVPALGSRFAFGPGRGGIVGVLLCTAGLIGALTLQRSIDHVLRTPALYGSDFDASNFLDDVADKRAMAEKLATDDDIEAVALVWTQRPFTALHVVGASGEGDAEPEAIDSLKGNITIRPTRGRVPGRRDEVALGRAVMDELSAGIGDRITAAGLSGDVVLTIVGEYLDPFGDIAGRGLAMTVDGLANLLDVSIVGTVVRFAPDVDHGAVIERHSEFVLQPVDPPSEVGNVGQLGGLPGRVGQLLTLLGIAALVNSVVQTVRHGRRELAIHRALGFTSVQVVGTHLWQAAITAAAGTVVGCGVGFVVARAIHRQLVGNVGAIAETVVPGTVWLVAMGILAACAVAGGVASALALHHRSGTVLHAE